MQGKPDEFRPHSFQESFQQVSNMLTMTVMTLGLFWTLCIRRFGTIGTRTYLVPSLLSLMIVLVLQAGTFEVEKFLFTLALMAHIGLYILHMATTLRRRATGRHVHSYHIGISRLGKHGIFIENVLGLGLGFLFVSLQLPIFGFYICVSSVCSMLTAGMVMDRDRHRAIVMQDAMYEQEHLYEVYRNRAGEN